VLRYLRLLGTQLRLSLTLAAQYRTDFFLDGLMSWFWLGFNLVPLLAVFAHNERIAGWSFAEALIVMGFFAVLEGLLESAINPSLRSVVEQIRNGTLDFVLLRPADSQFLIATVRFDFWRMLEVPGGLLVIAYALHRLGHLPSIAQVLISLGLLLSAIVFLYSLWFMVVSAAFWVIRVDNLTSLFTSVFDAARWPVHIFRGAFRVLFTFVIPLGLMTTAPSEALLGRLAPSTVWISLGGSLLFALFSRLVWNRALAQYTSASS